ncbi:MAG: hypothetical protein GX558_00225 [Clostridiales bacterium]|nr:hypothetical protein [Clostridiales bacterium]
MGLDAIVNAILTEARAEADALLARARSDAEQTLADARDEAAALTEQALADAREQADGILRRARVDAEMASARLLLSEKRRQLDRAVAEARSTAQALPDRQYFDWLIRLAAGVAERREGEMLLSPRDLARLPDGFERALNGALPPGGRLTVAPEGRAIGGGFVLRYGEIEQNCSLDAIFADRSDEIVDAAGEALFRSEV